MLVILKETVKGTGKAGEVVEVSDGFARNVLFRKGVAVEATKANVKILEKQKELQAKKDAENKETAEAQAKAFESLKVTIKAKCGDDGRLFGSVTSKDISDALKAQAGYEIDKKKIELDGPIKMLGTFDVTIKLYQDIKGKLKVEVVK